MEKTCSPFDTHSLTAQAFHHHAAQRTMRHLVREQYKQLVLIELTWVLGVRGSWLHVLGYRILQPQSEALCLGSALQLMQEHLTPQIMVLA